MRTGFLHHAADFAFPGRRESLPTGADLRVENERVWRRVQSPLQGPNAKLRDSRGLICAPLLVELLLSFLLSLLLSLSPSPSPFLSLFSPYLQTRASLRTH